MTRAEIEEFVEVYGEEVLLVDGIDDAFIGLTTVSSETVAVYNSDLAVKAPMKTNKWSYDEALDWFEFNIVNSKVGSKSPIFVDPIPS